MMRPRPLRSLLSLSTVFALGPCCQVVGATATSDGADKDLNIIENATPAQAKPHSAKHVGKSGKSASSGFSGTGSVTVSAGSGKGGSSAKANAVKTSPKKKNDKEETVVTVKSRPSAEHANSSNASSSVTRPADKPADVNAKENTATDAIPSDKPDAASTGKDAAKVSLSAAENSFGFATYKKLVGSDAKNLFISPLSLHSCLQMLFNGASGNTASEMSHVLGFGSESAATENERYTKLMSELLPSAESGTPLFAFSSANSLWTNTDVTLKPAFAETSKKIFDAKVSSLDFSKPDSVSTINTWVNDQTHGKIPKIIDQLRADQVMVAVNAAYFKARWKKVFDKALTQDGDFATAGGAKKVPLMNIKGDYNYIENEQFQAVELPYEGGKTSLVVFLPNEKSSLAAWRESLSSDTWTSWTDKMDLQSGELTLPKFSMHYESLCKEVLSALGMKQAFEVNADFSGIVEPPSKATLSEVMHKTFVKVDEEGTEAAAATASMEKMLSMVVDKGPQPFKMVVNRPFFFAVMNWRTRAILFVGQCVDPTEG